MKVITRRALPSDADSISGLYLLARRAAAIAGTVPALVHDDDGVRRWVADRVVPSLECWIADYSDRAMVGMLVLDQDWIDHLYVAPDLTGREIGSELITVAKRERPAGLQLWTFVSNTGAQRFYSQHGFRELQRTDGSGNEERAPDIHYAWQGPSPVLLSS
ncbi:GNAT family N-acetyltransferase [Conexibacter sp. S30A1]|uniref:GNAT family N-acetyltransferase n=1 Tax=Conexibacter sp. S30A1 TaxID=2937800 RepID=UPI00200ED9EB|nr:GNAT family N-acetyltransferase [Conexibacter sp. S30A1]